MDDSTARDLAAVIAEEIEAQLGVHRRMEDMLGLIADAFQVQHRDGVEFRFSV